MTDSTDAVQPDVTPALHVEGDKPACCKSWVIAGFVLAIVILVVDQILKWAVLEHVFRPALDALNVTLPFAAPLSFTQWLAAAPDRLPFYSMEILPFFNLTMVWNQGVSFGMLAADSAMGRYALVVMSLVICAAMVFMMLRTTRKIEIISMGMVIGGALGNVLDRLRFGAVADFIDVHAFGYHFPVFNVADAAITIGIAILIVFGLFWSGADKRHDDEKSDM